ncbi:type VI secretion system protein TssL, long form [Chelatococcus sp. GCM10030263]|uniref:type VI secretion system protein TssL, long form n=1 Tax=Chelatococcus sp. GCM10030263 TaxID=3273387 RepID=UPI00360BDC1B
MPTDNPFAEHHLPEFGAAPDAAAGARPLCAAQRDVEGPRDLPPVAKAAARRALTTAAANPLLAAASRLTWLAGRFPDLATDDVADLRGIIMDELRTIGSDTRLDRQIRASVCYALAATFDDLALNMPWAGADIWASNTLVSLLFSEAWSGERFFDLLAQLMHDPARHIDLLELLAVCLAVGFQGKFRVLPGGQVQLERVRAELHRAIDHVRGTEDPFQRAACAANPYRAPSLSRTAAVAAAITALLTAILCAATIAVLVSDLHAAAREVSRLVPGTVSRLRPLAPPPPPLPATAEAPPKPAEPAEAPQVRIHRLLAKEEQAGLLTVVEKGGRVMVRVAGTGLFASGKATIAPTAEGLIDTIAAALGADPGPLLVVGHADNQPINTREFPSNTVLALKRAEAVAEALRSRLGEDTRITVESRGDTEPLASNATSEGRALNRRIEIILP